MNLPKRLSTRSLFSFSLCSVLSASTLSAITLNIDYSNSTSSFFDINNANASIAAQAQQARAAVNAAASDVSAVITSQLNGVSNYAFQGTNGLNQIDINANYSYTNPDTGVSTNFTGNLAANEVRIFVGSRALTGSTLGEGGPGSFGFTIGGQSSVTGSLQAATDQAAANASAGLTRGGTVTGSLSGDISGANYTVNAGPALGNLWFDNDGSTNWHFDHTTAVAVGTIDLYSVALHEMIHAVGIGLYPSWNANVSGTNWLGANAIAVHGTGTNLIAADGGHIADNIMSARLSDGVMQEVVMDPNITEGARKELTQLDVAFLQDIGWQTVPEPSTSILLMLGGLSLVLRRSRTSIV